MPPGEARAWLAGKDSQHVPSATSHTSMVVNKVIGLLEQSRARTHYSSSEHFNRTLRLWEGLSRRAEMDEWLELCEGLLRGLDPLIEAFARLAQHAWYSYEDALGLIYMNLNLGDVRKGQFFTPFAVARMIAEMTFADWQPPYGPAGPAYIVYEPACGSGVLFLGAMAVMDERFPESFPVLLRRGLILFRGIDIDPTAILMTTLNLRLRGYPFAAETLTVGDALKQPRPTLPELAPPVSVPELLVASPPSMVEASEGDSSSDRADRAASEQYFFF